MGKLCAVSGCGTNTSNKTGISTFKFPETPVHLRRAWINFVKTARKNFIVPTPHQVVCANHFTPESFEDEFTLHLRLEAGYTAKRRLKPDAVPTVLTEKCKSALSRKASKNTTDYRARAKPRMCRSVIKSLHAIKSVSENLERGCMVNIKPTRRSKGLPAIKPESMAKNQNHSPEIYIDHATDDVHKDEKDQEWLAEHKTEMSGLFQGTGGEVYNWPTNGEPLSPDGGLNKDNGTNTVDQPYTCQMCGKLFSKKRNLTVHITLCKDCYKCNVCGKSLKKSRYLAVHMKTHTGVHPHRCETCGKSFTIRGSLTQHMRTHTGERPYRCDTCGKSFTVSGNLIIHMRTHTGERPYRCDICDKSFIQLGGFTQHMRAHNGDYPYRCEACGKSFTSSSSLKVHMRSHSGEHPYKCHTCGKAFTVSSNLIVHMRKHTGEHPYRCDICGKSFIQHGGLTQHMRTHNGERPYNCDTCGKSYRQSRSLTKHMRTHNGKHPYSCKQYGNPFTESSGHPYTCKSLQQNGHRSTHMKTLTGGHARTGGTFNEDITLSCTQHYVCVTCAILFIRIDDLNAHLRTHTGH